MHVGTYIYVNAMITTLKIELYFGGYTENLNECIRIIEIDEESDLEDLHLVIQQSVGFDNDHMYEFFIANSTHSREKIRFDDENEGIWEYEIKELFPLPKHKKLFYLFDYGDSWYFRISKTRHKEKIMDPKLKYPRLIKKIGKNPEQYPEYEF